MSFEESGILRRCHATLVGGSFLRAAPLVAALAGCEAGAPRPRAPAPPRRAAEPAAPRAEAPSAAPPSDEAAAGAGRPDVPEAEPAPPDPRLAFEEPYAAGAYPWPASAGDKRELRAELARWNAGGLGPGKPWHPQPRVVISEPVVLRGVVDVGATTRALRAGRYGAVRACYDQALQAEPELEGRTVLRLTVGRKGSITRSGAGGGRVPDSRKFGRAMGSAPVRSCLARAFQGARAATPKGAEASVLVAVDLWPGDVSLPVGSPGPLAGSLDRAAAREHVEARRGELAACFRAADERQPGVWGRLLLRIDVGADGKAFASAEHESTFPDRAASRCAADVLRQAPWPLPQGGEARVMVPLRWGTPPSSPSSPP